MNMGSKNNTNDSYEYQHQQLLTPQPRLFKSYQQPTMYSLFFDNNLNHLREHQLQERSQINTLTPESKSQFIGTDFPQLPTSVANNHISFSPRTEELRGRALTSTMENSFCSSSS